MYKVNSQKIVKICHIFKYCLLAVLIAFCLVSVKAYSIEAKNSSKDIIQSREEIVSLEEFSETIARLESKWENDYERYFNRNFSKRSSSARQIAKHLAEINRQVGIKPAVIWAVPKDNFLQLMLITPGEQFVTKKVWGGNRESLALKIKELEVGIADAKSLNYFPPARIIYQWFFKPLEPYLEAEGIDTLLLCTGPGLRSLPFAVLHDGENFMMEKYNLARIPAFSLTNTDYKPVPDRQVLAMGTSEFENLPSLPGVETELNTIVPKIWSGLVIDERDFTIDNLVKAHQQGDFDIIHLATHSWFNPGSPKDSYIQFSDRKLNLEQLADLDLEIPEVDLLVLSACKTALGNKDAEFGFAGLAMQAGVKSALASLWSVSDAGTVVLMSKFYEQLKSTTIKSQALRQAQMSLLNQKILVEGNKVKGLDVEVTLPANSVNAEVQDFTHPFYWAGFTIIGNPW